MTKLREGAQHALDGVLRDGMTILVGGFGPSGVPEMLVDAVSDANVRDLTVISNNCGGEFEIDGRSAGFGLWKCLARGQIRRFVGSYIGGNKLLESRIMADAIELELVPQGTLAERIRAGGAGIPAFFTPTGVGTELAAGKRVETFGGRDYLLEEAISADLAIVKAWRGDHAGNLVFRKTARNFNPEMAAAGRMTIAEVDELVPAGALDPDHVHLPGIYVDRIVSCAGYEGTIHWADAAGDDAAAAVPGAVR